MPPVPRTRIYTAVVLLVAFAADLFYASLDVFALVLGLIVANSGLALMAGAGMLRAERNFAVYATLAVIVAVLSIAMGSLFLFDLDVLPALDL